MIQVTIGGKRLGSGSGIEVGMHHYNRSTNNLNASFRSSLSSGLLYPAYINYGVNGDVFEIDIDAFTRTIPTKGPLFGSYKMQVDFFVSPERLYQGVLHNNPTKIAQKMDQVYLPSIMLESEYKVRQDGTFKQIDEANIWHYLNQSGLGRKLTAPTENETIKRIIPHATSLLAYYDIFKCYYANKQEDEAYVVTGEQIKTKTVKAIVENVYFCNTTYYEESECVQFNHKQNGIWEYIIEIGSNLGKTIVVKGENLTYIDKDNKEQINIRSYTHNGTFNTYFTPIKISKNEIIYECGTEIDIRTTYYIEELTNTSYDVTTTPLKLTKFPLSNIDDMRYELLYTRLGEKIRIDEIAVEKGLELPYLAGSQADVANQKFSLLNPLAGLVCKTYQSDLFNNWINSELIDGENGISELTKVDTSGGLYMDQLNLAQKTYELFNRIAASDGTYQGWQAAVFTPKKIRECETPMYYGGYSAEIQFEEIVATAETEVQDDKTVLGKMGGRGIPTKQKGGKVRIELDEPSIIMAIVSLTPRVCYGQGNAWYNTEIQTMNDYHKPALDGIGYQDLIVEQMAWWDTVVDEQGEVVSRNSAGKIPAWTNYRTDIDRVHGDFAKVDGYGYMVLNRDYLMEVSEQGVLQAPGDITTYIDPSKYNYAFAYTELDAQNFWTEIQFKVEKRGLISAAEIPSV